MKDSRISPSIRSAVVLVGEALIVIGVPVPAGTPTENLALAVLEPADAIDDGDGETAEWVLLPGTFDPETETLAVGLGAIMEDGRIFCWCGRRTTTRWPQRAPKASAARSRSSSTMASGSAASASPAAPARPPTGPRPRPRSTTSTQPGWRASATPSRD